MENLINEGIARKIRGLLNKARGNENEAEAAMFAQKAAELLQKHNLSEADLGGDDAKEPLITRTIHSVDWNPWRMDLIQALSGLYFSKLYISREIHQGKLRRAIVLVGRPHNLDIVQSMYEYLEKTVQRLAKEYSRLRKDILGFEKGCGTRLSHRVNVMATNAQAPAIQISAGNSNLPALYKTELQLAQDMVDGICGGRLARASGHRGGGNAVAAGRAAADKIHLGGQIGSGKGPVLKSGHLLGSK